MNGDVFCVRDDGDLNPVIPNQFQQLTVRKPHTHTTVPVPARGGDRQQTMMRRSTDTKPPKNDSQSWDVTNRISPGHGTYEFTGDDG